MSVESNISLLVATLDLKIVKSIRGAMSAADAASGKLSAATAIGPAPSRPMRFLDADRFDAQSRPIHPSPAIQARKIYHPTPTYAPRRVIHPEPQVALPAPAPAQPEGARASKSWVQPPWRTLPWENPVPAALEIKRTVHVHDKNHTGQILDLFI